MTTDAAATGRPAGRPVPYDAELAAGLAAKPELVGPSDITPERIAEVRRSREGLAPSDEELARGGRFEVTDLTLPGLEGDPEIALLVCRPAAAAGLVPVIYFVHGGGMVFNDRRTGGFAAALDWGEQLGCAVASIEYRLPPEHPHPAPVRDCSAGLNWIHQHAGELGLHAERVILAGMSAGAGLAAATALLNREHGTVPLICQMLVAPMLDDRCDTRSMHQMHGPGVWDRTTSQTGWGALLGGRRGGPDVSEFAAPARARDLAGLPPTFIDIGSADAFRDEAVAYASAIWRDGGRAELHVWPGGFHGFDFFVPEAAVSRAAREARVAWLRRSLATVGQARS
jgi:acetyl esterase/lipase